MAKKNRDTFCLIVTGGTTEPELLRSVYEGAYGYPAHPYVVGVDRGLDILQQLSIKPDFAVGDFDSASGSVRDAYLNAPGGPVRDDCLILKPEKDYTDTHAALMLAQETGFKRLLFMGATGTRADHTLANIALLYECARLGVEAEILDSHNRISLMTGHKKIIRAEETYGDYISLLPCSAFVSDICLTGFKYDVSHLTIRMGETIGISNELSKKEGLITVGDGSLYVMETKD